MADELTPTDRAWTAVREHLAHQVPVDVIDTWFDAAPKALCGVQDGHELVIGLDANLASFAHPRFHALLQAAARDAYPTRTLTVRIVPHDPLTNPTP